MAVVVGITVMGCSAVLALVIYVLCKAARNEQDWEDDGK